MCSQTRNSCAKDFDNRLRSKNLKPKKSRGGGGPNLIPSPSRLLGLKYQFTPILVTMNNAIKQNNKQAENFVACVGY